MSIKARIEDAQILYKNGRKEGALLSILTAVVATSRKRYPKSTGKKNGEAFKDIISDEMPKWAPGWSKNTTVDVLFHEKPLSLRDVLWHCVRCELAHAAKLREDIGFESRNGVGVTVLDNEKITFTDGVISCLAKIVVEAPENNDLFKRN